MYGRLIPRVIEIYMVIRKKKKKRGGSGRYPADIFPKSFEVNSLDLWTSRADFFDGIAMRIICQGASERCHRGRAIVNSGGYRYNSPRSGGTSVRDK